MVTNYFVFKNAKIAYLHNTLNLSKPTLVCLHGFLEHKGIFTFLFDDVYFATYNILSIDLLGHCESDCIGFVHQTEDQATMVYELLKHLQIKKVSIIGHSLGGYVALAFLELYPKLVTKIYLLNSTTKADSDLKKINRLRGIELVKKNASLFIQMALANLFDEQTKELCPTQINSLKHIALQNKTQGVIANMLGMKDRKGRSFLLEKYPKKIIYMVGTHDLILPIADVKNEVENFKVQFYEINGYHMLWLEKPNEIKKILKDYL